MIARALLLLLLTLLLLPGPRATAAAAERPPLQGRVSFVYDGDTIRVQGVGKVRLLGIDAPEHADSERDRFYRRWGIRPPTLRRIAAAARNYLRRTAGGRVVTLELDGPTRDKYGRILAYVYLPDHSLLNRALLEMGYASVFRKYAFRRKTDFLRAEERARRQRRGLWSGSRP